jgi:hypothetical protein
VVGHDAVGAVCVAHDNCPDFTRDERVGDLAQRSVGEMHATASSIRPAT